MLGKRVQVHSLERAEVRERPRYRPATVLEWLSGGHEEIGRRKRQPGLFLLRAYGQTGKLAQAGTQTPLNPVGRPQHVFTAHREPGP